MKNTIVQLDNFVYMFKESIRICDKYRYSHEVVHFSPSSKKKKNNLSKTTVFQYSTPHFFHFKVSGAILYLFELSVISLKRVDMWALEILKLIAYAQVPLINAHADISSEARGVSVGLNLHLYAHFVYASSDDSQEPSLLADTIRTEISCTDQSLI